MTLSSFSKTSVSSSPPQGENQEAKMVPSKYFPELKPKLPDMTGKIVAITGCTTGTGYVCAKTCAEKGAKVIMLNRASVRADAALENIKKDVPDAEVSLVVVDLMDFASVREAAQQLHKELKDVGLDVLCNNAGIMATKDEATKDGCDTQMQTNHLSHFLLCAEVWPLLEKAAELRGEARVVNHSSGARGMPRHKLEEKYLQKNGGNLGGDEAGWMPMSGGRWKRYQQSKLANVAFTFALRDRLAGTGSKVKSVCCEPGGAQTNLGATVAGDGGMSKATQKNLELDDPIWGRWCLPVAHLLLHARGEHWRHLSSRKRNVGTCQTSGT